MYLKKNEIKDYFSVKDYARGVECFHRGQVEILSENDSNGMTQVNCLVHGTDDYRSLFRIQNRRLTGVYCSCPRFALRHTCKHIAAGLLAYEYQKEHAGSKPASKRYVKSDQYALNLLQTYMDKSQPELPRAGEARLIPRIRRGGGNGDYPSFTFLVGFDKPYVVKDIRAFLNSVMKKETVAYGKNLTLCHAPEQFDELSRAMIDILMDQFREFRNVIRRSSYYDSYWPSGDKNQVVLMGDDFDRWFKLLRQKPIDTDTKGSFVTFADEDPQVSVSLERNDKLARLTVKKDPDLDFFGSRRSLYAFCGDRLLHCSGKFREKVWPLLNAGADEMRLALSDMPAFCSCVLPEVQDLVTLDDPHDLLQEFLPDECTSCFYFDMEEDALTLRVAFRYGKKEISPNTPASKTRSVKRDVRMEQDTLQFAGRYLEPLDNNNDNNSDNHDSARFVLSGDDAVFDFLSEYMGGFQERGEVFVTDRLREKRIQPSGAVGVSVSGGILSLDIDTGEFPPEELEALYQSLLKKRRYHRLPDGRYLALDGGSPYETMAEMTHMLQLSPKDLAGGTVNMPSYRGLYIDSILSKNGAGDQQTLKIRRDKQFRAMIRNFKTVEESDYALPDGLEDTLRPYQKVGFQWLKTLESSGFGGILADEMGLGKTAQVIAFLSTASREKTGTASLVVCPASLILNWMDELAKFAPDLHALPIMGTAAERKKLIAADGEYDIWVTSYELLRQDIARYEEMSFYGCILDEAQHIKNQSTLASKAVKKINCKQRFILTGTPIENRLSELWNLFDFLMPGYLFSHRSFVEKLEKPVVKSKDADAMAQLQRLVQPFMLRRLKKDVLKELPPKIEYVRRIPFGEEERKTYLAAVSAAKRNLLDGGEQGKLQILAALTQLRQICCNPSLCFENYHGPASKLEACLELCAGMVENSHQILLFSQFTSMLDILRRRLDEMRISNFTLQGSTPKKERAALVKSFNAGGASVFLISLKAGGTGLNLTAADIVIHYDPWWNQAAQDQATDRAHRIGQQAHVQVYKLIAQDTIEEKILNLQEQKASLMDAVSSGSGESLLSMSKEDLLMLLE